MRILTGRAGLRSLRRRAATMLEFAFILPIFTFMLMFTVDMGHLILMSGAMQDATFSAARTGAQVGGAAIDARGKGSLVCGGQSANGQPCKAGSTYRSLTQTAEQIPGYGKLGKLTGMKIVRGAVCQSGTANNHVAIESTYSTKLVTPGLKPMLAMFSKAKANSPDGDWVLKATAVARCEVVRS